VNTPATEVTKLSSGLRVASEVICELGNSVMKISLSVVQTQTWNNVSISFLTRKFNPEQPTNADLAW